MLDGILEWTVTLLPFVLSGGGLLVSIEAPKSHHKKRWYGGLIVFGIAMSGVTWWQQSRARKTHDAELSALKTQLSRIQRNTETPPTVQVTNNVPPAQVVVTERNGSADKRAESPCFDPLHFSVKRTQSDAAPYRRELTVDLKGSSKVRIYHSPGYLNPGLEQLPNGGYMSSSSDSVIDVSFANAPPPELKLAFNAEMEFSIVCVDRIQKTSSASDAH